GSRESGVGSRESGVGSRESGVGSRDRSPHEAKRNAGIGGWDRSRPVSSQARSACRLPTPHSPLPTLLRIFPRLPDLLRADAPILKKAHLLGLQARLAGELTVISQANTAREGNPFLLVRFQVAADQRLADAALLQVVANAQRALALALAHGDKGLCKAIFALQRLVRQVLDDSVDKLRGGKAAGELLPQFQAGVFSLGQQGHGSIADGAWADLRLLLLVLVRPLRCTQAFGTDHYSCSTSSC